MEAVLRNNYKGLVARSHSLLVFIIIYIHTHSSIIFAEFRSNFLISVRSGRGLSWGVEPGFELGDAFYQPDALPNQLSHAARSNKSALGKKI